MFLNKLSSYIGIPFEELNNIIRCQDTDIEIDLFDGFKEFVDNLGINVKEYNYDTWWLIVFGYFKNRISKCNNDKESDELVCFIDLIDEGNVYPWYWYMFYKMSE